MNDCLFCKIAGKQIPAKIIFENDQLLAFHDIHPQSPVHILIIPRAHIATLNDLQPEHTELMGQLVFQAKKIAKDFGLSENGFRLVLNCNWEAGQSVYHIHLHLLGGRKMKWPPG